MRQNKIRIFQEILITQINFLVFYPFAMTVATLFRNMVPPERPSLLVWILAGLIPLGFHLIRNKLKQFFPLVLLHLVGIGGFVLLSFLLSPQNSSVNRTYFILVGIGFAVYSIYLRLTTEDFDDSVVAMPFAVGFVAVSLFLQHYQGNKEWDSYYKLILILIVGLFFLNYYLSEYSNFLVVNSSSTGILPEKQIFRSGMRLTFGYTLIGMVILFCTAQFSWLKQILAALKRTIVSILSFIFGLFPDHTTESEIYIDERMSGGGGLALPEAGEPALIWHILGVIAVVALLIGILVAIFFAIRRFIAFANQMMQKQGITKKDISATEAVDVREKCEIKKQKHRKSSPLELFGFLDSKEKIRRIYKKKASSYKPNPLAEGAKEDNFTMERLGFYTAREMEKRMESGAFAAVYEKARYSNETCTAQDVKLMKEACR